MFQLRDYQDGALTAIKDAYDAGTWSQVLVLPTGGGKTVVFSQLRKRLAQSFGDVDDLKYKVLVLAHRDELLTQARDKMLEHNGELFVEIEAADQRASPFADIVIASVQTLAARNYARIDRFDIDRFKIVVVDEAHHSAADTYKGVLRRCGLLPPDALMPQHKNDVHAARLRVARWRAETRPQKLLLGVTATPSRADALGLEWVYERVVYEKSLRWMIEHGYLVRPVGYQVETGLSLDGVKTVAGDFQQQGLSTLVNTVERNAAIVAAWHDHARGLRTLAFGVDVQHAKDLAAAFAQYGVRAVSVDGTAARDDRADILRRYKRGEIDVVTNCALFTEGYDEPSIACIIMARPTQSQTLYSQMVGRGLRLFEGKRVCVVIDGVDNTTRHALVTLGDLFGLPQRFKLDGDDAAQAQADLDALAENYPTLDLSDARSLDEVRRRVREVDLFEAKVSPLVQEHARMEWIERVKGAKYVLEIPAERQARTAQAEQGTRTSGGRSLLTITLGTLGDWRVMVEAPNVAPYMVGIIGDVRDAFAVGERWLRVHRAEAATLHDRDARWRKDPPTRAQIVRLQEWGATKIPATKGEASQMITAYINRKRR